MATPVIGHSQQFWALGQAVFDTAEAFASTDGIGLLELEIEGGDPEWHESEEQTGSPSLQTEIQGQRTGQKWTAKSYVKPRTLGIPPDIHELLRLGYGRMEVDLTVLAFGSGGTDTVTVTIDGAASVLTEGAEFAAATSNDVTATNIAAAVAALTGITSATATGAVVTAYSDTVSVSIASGDAAAWTPTAVRFSLTSAIPPGLQLCKYTDEALYELVSGAWVEQIEYEQKTNEEGTISFSGSFARKGFVHGEPQTDTAGYTGVALITLASGHNGKINAPAYVYFERVSDGTLEDNSGAGYLVSSVDFAAGTITLSVVLAGALSAAAWYVRPFVPAHSIGGTIQGGVSNALTIAGTQVDPNEFKITLDTGVRGLAGEISTDRANRLSRGPRKATCEGNFYFLEAKVSQVGLAWNGTTQAVALRQGPATAGSRCTTTLGSCRLRVSKVEVSKDEEAMFKANGVGRQVSVANDELVNSWN